MGARARHRLSTPVRVAMALAVAAVVVVLVAAAVIVVGTGGPATTTSGTAKGASATPSLWIPAAGSGLQWQWVLDHPLSTSSSADLGVGDATYAGTPAGDPTVYDIDGFDNTATTVSVLHARGAHVVCYVDVGTWENWRPDAPSFPEALLGRSNGWRGERWLDTSPTDPDYATLQRIITARLQMCQSKGFDAVEPDNIDGAENTTGFGITTAQGDAYARWVAAEVHSLGMAVAQKNMVDQSSALEPSFDFAVVEQCYQDRTCGDLAPYTQAHKAVLEVEYADQGARPESYCPAAVARGFSSLLLDTALDARVRVPCAPSP